MAKTIKVKKSELSSVCTQCDKAGSGVGDAKLSLPGMGGTAPALSAYRERATSLAKLAGQYAQMVHADVKALRNLGKSLEDADEKAAKGF